MQVNYSLTVLDIVSFEAVFLGYVTQGSSGCEQPFLWGDYVR